MKNGKRKNVQAHASANSDKYKRFIQYEVHRTYPELGQIISCSKKLKKMHFFFVICSLLM